MECKRCGASLPSNTYVCRSCGAMMSEDQIKIQKQFNMENAKNTKPTLRSELFGVNKNYTYEQHEKKKGGWVFAIAIILLLAILIFLITYVL